MKYVTIYRRMDSPFWWRAHYDPRKRRRLYAATPYRLDDPQGKRKALNDSSRLSALAQADAKLVGHERWERWVEPFLRGRYAGRTLVRYLGAWKQWQAFLDERGVGVPGALDFQAVADFVTWREAQVKRRSKRRVSRNTALCDVRCMGVVMQQAIRLGFAAGNPCFRTGIARERPREKPEISAADAELIRAKLPEWIARDPKQYGWMRPAFEVAIWQGCRLRETQLDLKRDVDFERATITFHIKGGRTFTTALHPRLAPVLRSLAADGRERACVVPVMGSRMFGQFFDWIGRPDITFHSTRVTVVTQLARAGVPIAQAMRYVGHSSEAVHRIYQKLASADLARAIEAIKS